jgi:hypothetical protein
LLSETVRHVLADRERVKEGGALKDVGDPAPDLAILRVVEVRDVLAVEVDRARILGDEADQDLEQYTLSAA